MNTIGFSHIPPKLTANTLHWRFLLVLVFFGLSFDGLAQNRYLTTGTGGTPMALSGDYRSLGWNPGHLTFSPLLEPNWKSAAGGVEIGARVSSSVLEREDVWDGIWSRTDGETDAWDTNEWSDYVDLLSNEHFAVNADVVSAAWAKKWTPGAWHIRTPNTSRRKRFSVMKPWGYSCRVVRRNGRRGLTPL